MYVRKLDSNSNRPYLIFTSETLEFKFIYKITVAKIKHISLPNNKIANKNVNHNF